MKHIAGLIFVLLVTACPAFGQDKETVAEEDSVFLSAKEVFKGDSLMVAEVITSLDTVKIFRPNPKKSVIFSAIFPGLGQIYNRKYWKLPLVYGSFIGCAYAITWNGAQYNGYRQAYLDFIDDNAATNYWENYMPASLPEKIDDWSSEQVNWFSNALKSRKDYYRHYRDMSYLVSIAVYAIWIVDAYVDAELFNFDVSPDLSMRLNPVLFERTRFNTQSFGLQCSFSF